MSASLASECEPTVSRHIQMDEKENLVLGKARVEITSEKEREILEIHIFFFGFFSTVNGKTKSEYRLSERICGPDG